MEISDTGFDFADLVDEAVELSGGQSAVAADVLRVRRALRLLTEEWNAEGYNLWRLDFLTEAVIPGQPEIRLPDYVDDIVNIGANSEPTTGADTGSPSLRRISEMEYAALANKLLPGQPTQYCLRRTGNPSLLIYPSGAPARTWFLDITFVRRPEQLRRYDPVDSQEVVGRWLPALVTGVALKLAKKRSPYPQDRVAGLELDYNKALMLAQMGDRGRQRYRYRIAL